MSEYNQKCPHGYPIYPSCKCPVYLEEMKRSNEEWESVEAEELEEMNNAAKELQDAIDEYGD